MLAERRLLSHIHPNVSDVYGHVQEFPLTLLPLPAVDSFAAPRRAYLGYRRPWKTHSRMPVETALTCSQNSQLALLFLVKNALELTEFLARDQCRNNNHARTFQLSALPELRGRRPSPLLV